MRRGLNYRRSARIVKSAHHVASYPEGAPEETRTLAGELGLTFPYLYDESQDLAWA